MRPDIPRGNNNNAYLEALTQEKVCIKAGPEFGDKEGHLLTVYKGLYGLRSSGKEFGDLLAACLKGQGFQRSKAEPEIFIYNQTRTAYMITLQPVLTIYV